MFKEFFYIFLIVVVHEFGHFIASFLFNWNLDKIAIYPFGGCVKFNEDINKPLKEELVILLSGPVFQMLLFLIVCILFKYCSFFTYRNFMIFKNYHYTLLIFNLLPIYPLDGGRLFNIVLNYFFPYKNSNKFVIIFSMCLTLLLLFLYKDFNFILMGLLILFELYIYLKNQDYLYNRMLLEKYIHPAKYKDVRVIKNKDLMYREKRHIIKYKDKYITERDYLKKRFR